MLGRHFDDVQIWGLDGDPVVKADFERRRRLARRLLALDVFDLRHRLPVGRYVQLHALGRRMAYPLFELAARLARWAGRPAPAPITEARFSLTRPIDPTTLVLFAVARKAHLLKLVVEVPIRTASNQLRRPRSPPADEAARSNPMPRAARAEQHRLPSARAAKRTAARARAALHEPCRASRGAAGRSEAAAAGSR